MAIYQYPEMKFGKNGKLSSNCRLKVNLEKHKLHVYSDCARFNLQ